MLNLIVICSKDIEVSKDFYSLFDMSFECEMHNDGVIHYACDVDGFVLEIYPESKRYKAESFTRLGFCVKDLERLKAILTDREIVFKELSGMISLEDPDGRKVFVQRKEHLI